MLGSIIALRLYDVESLPAPLLPTIAIELAPPVVAGNTWFLINGGKVDTPAFILAGLSLLWTLVQFRLIPLYRRAPSGPGYWAFCFPFSAACTYAVHWLAAEHMPSGKALAYTLVGLLTIAFALLAERTITGLRDGTFLPRVPGPVRPRLTGSRSHRSSVTSPRGCEQQISRLPSAGSSTGSGE